ncbi:hypothetical protein TSST111916_16190 [Tsukamurella strandjordii]|uniref:hypothetical protein n=1 Tax=Tsukamurella TaxID=2060 RepID=UPI001C7CC027|nr:hypothetical protein [Tsukamurella sp. TY48]GIZ95494.1 hypothetical protein TTY48_01060 [Tsukamurella sp. TY48]
MNITIDLFGYKVLAVTIGLAGEAPDGGEDFGPDSPAYELGSDTLPVERADWLDDDEDAPRPLVIVRGDHLRGRTTRTRRNPPPIMRHVSPPPTARNSSPDRTTFGFHK